MTGAVDAPPAVLTVVVPAYNAQDYLVRALGPLRDANGVEVLIVDDGSEDGTAAIADDHARRWPHRYRVIHQANGGHGGAINAGIAAARGTYLKVLDADDWLDGDALAATLQRLLELESSGGVDALFTDYVHERLGKSTKAMKFASVFPAGRVFGWDEVDRFSRRQVLMMHAIIYRTDLLRRCGMLLPEHTYYVDNLFVLFPLRHVRTMAYLPVDLYRYFIGRTDQSINASVMVRRADQQLRVNRLALGALPVEDAVRSGAVPAGLYATLLHHLEAVCAVTSATLARGGTPQHLAARDEFWRAVRDEHPSLYLRSRRSLMGASSNLPGETGRRVTSLAYHVARRVVGFS